MRNIFVSKKPKPTPRPELEIDLEGIDPVVYKRRWWTLAALCLTLIGVMLANSSLNMALPLLSADLNLGQLELTWIVNIYTLIFASLLFIAGAAGDRYGRKLAMQIGLAIFTVGSVYAGLLAQTGTELIVARLIMGLGGALVMPTTLSIINNTFPTGERARAVAIWSAVAGVGMMIGSVISGLLLEFFTWHSLFYFSATVAVIGFVANQYLSQESRDEEETPVDWVGGILAAIGIFGIVYGVTEAPSEGMADTGVLVGILGGLFATCLFVLWQLRSAAPTLDVRLFKDRAFTIASLTLTLTFLAMAGVFFSMSQLMQLILGFTALESSLSMIPLMLPMMILSPYVPNIVAKFGARLTISIGLMAVTLAFVSMSFWTADMTYWHLFGTMIVMMLGISAAMTPGTNILMASVPRNRSGMGSAMNDTTRELGGALGVAILGAILGSVYESKIADTAANFTGPVRQGLESSLAVALEVAESLGPAAAGVADAAKAAWMSGMSSAALVAAVIIFACAILAFIGLPKHRTNSNVM